MEGAGYFCSFATIYQTKRCQDTEHQNRNLHSREKFKSHKPQNHTSGIRIFLIVLKCPTPCILDNHIIRPNGVRMQNTKIGIFRSVRNSNLTSLKNHTADTRIRLFWSFQLGAFLQPIHLFIPTKAHNTLNVHLVDIKIRNWSEFSVYPVPLLPALHVYTQLLKPRMFDTVLSLCPLKLSYSNFIIFLSHIAANLSILFITPVYKNIFSAEITNEWTCTSTPLTRSLSVFSRFTWHLYRSGAGKASQYNDKAKSWTIRESWFDSQQGFPSTSKNSTPALRPRLPPVQRTLGVPYTGCKATVFWGLTAHI